MHALICINQYTKVEVPSYTNYKYMTENKICKNGSLDSDHASFRDDLLSMG